MDSPLGPHGKWRWPTHWWRRRDWRAFLAGLPALLGLIGIGVIVTGAWAKQDRELRAQYLVEGKAAFHRGDYTSAKTCFERLSPEDSDPEVTYWLALTVEALGDSDRAAKLMSSLTPPDGTGYPRAHYWWARRSLAAQPSPRTLAGAETHLLRALSGDIDDKDVAHGLLGQLYLSTNRPGEAEFHLAKAVSTRPIFRLPLARAYAARGNLERARHEADLSVRFFRERAAADATNVTARLAWADALVLLEDYKAATTVLEEGITTRGTPAYRLAMARVYVAWFDARKKEPEPPTTELLHLLDQGLTADPANGVLLTRLLGILAISGPKAEEARSTLRGLLAKGGASVAGIHFGLAVDAHLRGDLPAETLHLEQAFRLDPKTGLIANNLAWVLSQQPKPDLPRALSLIQIAIDREPTNPTYRDTRGHIWIAMQKWNDALVDLELVLTKAPETQGIHAALADVYGHLNQPAMAAEHRKLAATLGKGREK